MPPLLPLPLRATPSEVEEPEHSGARGAANLLPHHRSMGEVLGDSSAVRAHALCATVEVAVVATGVVVEGDGVVVEWRWA